MGQVGSIDKSSIKPPISISNGLLLRRIHLTHDSKIINIDNDQTEGGIIQFPTTPLSEFIQNDNSEEFPFLLKLSNRGDVLLSFGLSNELLSDFNQMITLKNFTIFNNLKISIMSSDDSKVLKDEIISRVVEISEKEQGNFIENNVISINPKTNQFDIKLNLNKLSGITGKVYVRMMGNNEEIFKTMVYLTGGAYVAEIVQNTSTNSDDLSKSNERKVEPVQFKDPQFKFISDGPAFRNNVSEIEESLTNFRALSKNVIKKSQALEESERNLAITRSNLCSSLSDLNNYSSEIDHSTLKGIINDVIPILTEKSTQNISDANLIMKNLTTPFLLYYNSDLKSLQSKKKIYQNHSKDFYSWMSKYLENDQPSDDDTQTNLRDQQYFEKRLNFEKERLEYFNFLNEYRNGYLSRGLMHSFAMFYRNIRNSEDNTENSNVAKALFLYDNFTDYQKQQTNFKTSLASAKNFQDLSQLISTPTPPTSSLNINRPKPIAKDSSKIFKDGVLYTLGGNLEKNGWNKHYVVLNNNMLSEFVDQESRKVPRSDPLDLTFSCIKKIDNIFKRQFCFEIITPLNLKRIYQTETEEERESWLKCLSIAIALKAQSNQFNMDPRPKSMQRSMSSVSRSKDDATTIARNKRTSSYRKSSYNPPSSSENLLLPTPLSIVQDVDQSNRVCCDCGSNKNVDWISINLLVVVCIECSGIHRSMGTHISKIRSLTLDNRSFQSKESTELLYHVSNNFANSYWEGAVLMKDKISPLSKSDQRKQFILDKYQNNKFVIKESKFKPNDCLIKGIHTLNVPLILKSLALGANVKMTVIKTLGVNKVELSLFEYSLTRFHGNQEDPIFDISTILLLNNTSCGEKITNNLPLGPKQLEFWKSKIAQYHSPPPAQSKTSIEPLSSAKSSIPRSKSIRKSLSIKSITEKKEKLPKDRTNRISRLRFPKLKSDKPQFNN